MMIFSTIVTIISISLALYLGYQWHVSKNLAEQIRSDLLAQEQLAISLQEQVTHQKAQNGQFQELVTAYEKEITQYRALNAAMSKVSYDFILVLDEANTLLAINNSASELFGEVNPIGKKLQDVLAVPDLEDIILRAAGEEETLEEQFVMNKRDYRARTQVIRHTDTEKYLTGIAIQDITQLVRLNRARRDMVANISHELRTPITKIRFVIDNLFHDVDRPKRKASISSLHEISTEVGTLEDVVQELLDLSMIESGQAIMKLVDEPLGEIVDAALERLSEKLESKEITIIKQVPSKMGVLCDREHIRRVITNLISNAIKWSPPKDSLTISAINNGDEVAISVFDNGPGVPDDQRERIFERFYQVDTARSGQEGSGLGLAICKHIVEAHGGKIWAEGNSQGNGGRFQFTLLNAEPPENDEIYIDKAQHNY